MIDKLQPQTFNGAATGVTICSRDGRFLQVNDTWAAITGYEEAELLTLDFQSVLHPEDRIHCTQLAGRLFSGETPHVVVETRCLRKDGRIRWVRASAALLTPNSAIDEAALAIVEDISLRKDAEAARDAAQLRLRTLAEKLAAVQEAERRRIARDIHDGTAQFLSALGMSLAAMNQPRVESARIRELAAEALDLVEQCSREVRNLSYLLHPPMVERLGLAAALETWLAGFARRSGIAIESRIQRDLRLEIDTERALFRILQEALANLYRHPGSRAATVELRCERGEAILEVEDHARAARSESVLRIGLAGFQERAELRGGSVTVVPVEGGTRLTARIPAG